MHKLYVLALILTSFIFCGFYSQLAGATDKGVVISQVQINDETSARNELIEIYNNSASDIEITNWCLYYASATPYAIGSKLTCFVPNNDDIHIYLPAYSLALAISNQMSTAFPDFGSDLKFSATLSDTAGHIRIIDNDDVEIDKLGWGATAVSPEGAGPALIPAEGKVFQRKSISPNTLQDTNVNGDDFELVSPRTKYSYGSIYEVQDLCLNISGVQELLPDDYIVDESGVCSIPTIDVCSNLTGIQSETPDGYLLSDDNTCLLDLLPLKISELLPNVAGVDDGKEFIEIYNPNDSEIDLENYVIYVGLDDKSFYNFPIGTQIEAGQYLAFYNNEIEYTLLNTTSEVRLKSIDGQLIDETPPYSSPDDDMAWALIDDTWQYTNRPTPSSGNLLSLIEIEVEAVAESNLEPCASNQYRNPETNRCRLIVTASAGSLLAPCKDGQYRSEETNRCRSIASDVSALTPCDEGQERNPETNRCRSIATVLGASELVPCDEGQERNPETNRCRNIVSMPLADYAPEQTAASDNGYVGWLALTGVGFVAIIYGIWEWRQEIAGIIRKIKLKINRKREKQI